MATILVIDDDARMRGFLRELLEEAGYEVSVAPDGKVGLRMFAEHKADLVITDIIMPETEGMETIYKLHEAFPDLPIIAISGGSPKGVGSYLSTAHELGACRVLAKPFSGKLLLDTVREVMQPAPATINWP